MKILYINHVGNLAGTSRSLLELISSFPKGKINAHIISPKGKFADTIRLKGIPIINTLGICQFDNTEYSHYRNLRWLILLREIVLFFFTINILIKARRVWGNFDIIHINEITMIPLVILIKFLFNKAKIVVHCRSKQRKKNNLRLQLINYLLMRNVNLIIAIDENVNSSLSNHLRKTTIHNGLNLQKTKIKYQIKDKQFIVGMVGMIHKSKGCFDFIKAASICIEKGYQIDFIFYGYEKFRPQTFLNKTLKLLGFKQDISLEIMNLIKKLKLSRHVYFKEFTTDFNEIYSKQKILCFTSLFDSPGRPIFEASFFKVPSIVAISQPMNDTFINNETGLTFLSSNYKDLAKKIMYMFDNPKVRRNMGEKAFLIANKNFNSIVNSNKVIEKYKEIIKT